MTVSNLDGANDTAVGVIFGKDGIGDENEWYIVRKHSGVAGSNRCFRYPEMEKGSGSRFVKGKPDYATSGGFNWKLTNFTVSNKLYINNWIR